VDSRNLQEVKAHQEFHDLVTKELKALSAKVVKLDSDGRQQHQDSRSMQMEGSQRLSNLENKLKTLEQRLESFQAPAIQKDISELEDKIRKVDQKASLLTDANKVAAMEDRKTIVRIDQLETDLEGLRTTLAPLQELLRDNQVVQSSEQQPSGANGCRATIPVEEAAFQGMNLDGASLEDLKKMRKLVNKKIKALSKQGTEPKSNLSPNEMTITYEKQQDETKLQEESEHHPDKKATRTQDPRHPTSNPNNSRKGMHQNPQKTRRKSSSHQVADTKHGNFGAEKVNTEEWVTVKRSNWNKYKELANSEGPRKPSSNGRDRTQIHQLHQRQSESQRIQGGGTPSLRNRNQRGKGQQTGGQVVHTPQIVASVTNPALMNPFYLPQPGINALNPGLHYPIGGTFLNGHPQQRFHFGY